MLLLPSLVAIVDAIKPGVRTRSVEKTGAPAACVGDLVVIAIVIVAC